MPTYNEIGKLCGLRLAVFSYKVHHFFEIIVYTEDDCASPGRAYGLAKSRDYGRLPKVSPFSLSVPVPVDRCRHLLRKNRENNISAKFSRDSTIRSRVILYADGHTNKHTTQYLVSE